MFEHLAPVYCEVDKTIAGLARAKFRFDPVLSAKRSRETSIASSAIKRHGAIMELALRYSLANSPAYQVWREPAFLVSQAADHLATDQHSQDAALVAEMPYATGLFDQARKVQIDLLAYDRRRSFLGAYELKRGSSYHDAGKIRQIKRDLCATSVLLRSYGKRRGLKVDGAAARAIFYYGERRIGPPWGMTAATLDDHFDWPVCRDIDEATRYFRAKLDALLERAEAPGTNNQLRLSFERDISLDDCFGWCVEQHELAELVDDSADDERSRSEN